MSTPQFDIHRVYYENRALFSSNNSQIYNKGKCNQARLIISYKLAMDLKIFLFESADPQK